MATKIFLAVLTTKRDVYDRLIQDLSKEAGYDVSGSCRMVSDAMSARGHTFTHFITLYSWVHIPNAIDLIQEFESRGVQRCTL